VLVVDDSSPDGTGDLADALAAEHDGCGAAPLGEERDRPRLPCRLPPRARRRRGLRDGDGLRLLPRPADLARLLAAVRAGADVALGSRYVPGGGVEEWGCCGASSARRIHLRAPGAGAEGARPHGRLQVLSPRGAAGHPVRRGSLAGLRLSGRADLPAVQAGFRVQEVPIVFRDRQRGESKMSWRIAAEAMWLVPGLRFR